MPGRQGNAKCAVRRTFPTSRYQLAGCVARRWDSHRVSRGHKGSEMYADAELGGDATGQAVSTKGECWRASQDSHRAERRDAGAGSGDWLLEC